MASLSVCDCCGKELGGENPLAAKLWLTPKNGKKTRDDHSAYSSHMDVGKCCVRKIIDLGKWQKRRQHE
jgi:hypothetical protein